MQSPQETSEAQEPREVDQQEPEQATGPNQLLDESEAKELDRQEEPVVGEDTSEDNNTSRPATDSVDEAVASTVEDKPEASTQEKSLESESPEEVKETTIEENKIVEDSQDKLKDPVAVDQSIEDHASSEELAAAEPISGAPASVELAAVEPSTEEPLSEELASEKPSDQAEETSGTEVIAKTNDENEAANHVLETNENPKDVKKYFKKEGSSSPSPSSTSGNLAPKATKKVESSPKT